MFFVGSVARLTGELDVVCGEYEVAIAHLEEGLAVDSGLSARPFVARGHLALARAVWAVGDRRRAVDLARQAADEAGRLDMPAWLGKPTLFWPTWAQWSVHPPP